MKSAEKILIWIMLSTLLLAENNSTTPPHSDKTLLFQQGEIKSLKTQVTQLKEKVKVLESELQGYKKVKPLVIKVTPTPHNHMQNTIQTDKKKFIFPAQKPKKLSAYFTAAYQDVDHLKFRLETNGFEVLAQDEILKDKIVLSLTNKALKATNSFISVLHILVNKDNELRIQNPSYFATAYLKEGYRYGDLNSTISDLEAVVGSLYESEEQYKLDALAGYNFMIGMPSVEDTIVVDRDTEILLKLQNEAFKKHISYVLTLPNGSVLLGHKLSEESYDYLNKIDVSFNAQLFPYQSMVSDGKAFILAPKYYLALCLPLLSMTDFMKIASAPSAIIEEIKKAYEAEVTEKTP